MKKLLSLLLVLTLSMTLVSCGGSSPNEGSEGEDSKNGIQVDEKIVTVDITLPASLFGNQDMSAFDADAYANESGFTKAVVKEDGSVTVTMSKAKHKEILLEMQTSVEETFAEMAGDPATPYIKNITHDKDFRTVTVEVEKEGYKNAFDMSAFMIGIQVMVYQAFTGEEANCEVVIKDIDSGEVLSTSVFPVEK